MAEVYAKFYLDPSFSREYYCNAASNIYVCRIYDSTTDSTAKFPIRDPTESKRQDPAFLDLYLGFVDPIFWKAYQ